MKVRIAAKNLGRAALLLSRQWPAFLRPALAVSGTKLVHSLRLATLAQRKVDTTALHAGWFFQTRRLSVILSNSSTHHRYVELGRRPGGRPPPFSLIEAWAVRRLGKSGLGWTIARAIGRRGIRPTPLLFSPVFQRLGRQTVRAECAKALRRSIEKAVKGRV